MIESRLVVARSWAGKGEGYRVSLSGDKNVLKLDCGDGYTNVHILKPTELYILKG